MLCSRAQVPFARGGRPRGTADRAPGVPKGLTMPPQLTSPFAQVPEQLHPEARRPERAQRPPGARFAPSSSHAPSYRRAGATGCPREPRHRPPGSPGEPAGLARWPRPHGWVTAGSGLRPDPEPRAPRSGGSRLGVRCDGFVIVLLLIYIELYIFNQYTPGKCPMGWGRLTRPRGSGGVGDRV